MEVGLHVPQVGPLASRENVERFARTADEAGIDPRLAEGLMLLLIESSLASQERQRVTSRSGGAGRRALVIGGAGRMGSWFARFLLGQGYQVSIADPAAAPAPPEIRSDWDGSDLTEDLIVVAAPLRPAREILAQLASRRPGGVIFDLGSVKAPLRSGLEALRDAGVRVASVHPLFGPDTELLAGRHVVLVDLGVPEANQVVRDLFAPTMAQLVTMDLEGHDRAMAWVLGLSHALNIAFLTVLAESSRSRAELEQVASTTFGRQLQVAAPVAVENPRLYFEIQHLNQYGPGLLESLGKAVDRIGAAVREGDEEAFVHLMENGRRWVEGTAR